MDDTMKRTSTCFLFLQFFSFFISARADEIVIEYGEKLGVTFMEELTPAERDGLERFNKNPVWSSDGIWIAFTDANGQSIRIVPSAGGVAFTVYKINGENSTNTFIKEICFTPDSQRIVFVVAVVDPELGGEIINHEDGSVTYRKCIPNIHSINIFSGEYRILKRGGFNPSWSCDGRYMTYIEFNERTWVGDTTFEHNGAPAIYDTITGETRYLTDYRITDITGLGGDYLLNIFKYPCISPDKKTVYFSLTISGTGQIARISFEGGTHEILTVFSNEDTRCNNIRISPDYSWLCFDTSHEIVLYKIETGEFFNFFTGRKFEERNYGTVESSSQCMHHACWAPDGTEICYNLSMYDTEIVNEYIHIISFNSDRYSGNSTSVNSRTPADFSMIGNYPNPFNPSTTIRFSIPEDNHVTIDVYNVSGQKVVTLENGLVTAGTHSVKWDASGFSAGIYFAKVKADNSMKTMKMTMIK